MTLSINEWGPRSSNEENIRVGPLLKARTPSQRNSEKGKPKYIIHSVKQPQIFIRHAWCVGWLSMSVYYDLLLNLQEKLRLVNNYHAVKLNKFQTRSVITGAINSSSPPPHLNGNIQYKSQRRRCIDLEFSTVSFN